MIYSRGLAICFVIFLAYSFASARRVARRASIEQSYEEANRGPVSTSVGSNRIKRSLYSSQTHSAVNTSSAVTSLPQRNLETEASNTDSEPSPITNPYTVAMVLASKSGQTPTSQDQHVTNTSTAPTVTSGESATNPTGNHTAEMGGNTTQYVGFNSSGCGTNKSHEYYHTKMNHTGMKSSESIDAVHQNGGSSSGELNGNGISNPVNDNGMKSPLGAISGNGGHNTNHTAEYNWSSFNSSPLKKNETGSGEINLNESKSSEVKHNGTNNEMGKGNELVQNQQQNSQLNGTETPSIASRINLPHTSLSISLVAIFLINFVLLSS